MKLLITALALFGATLVEGDAPRRLEIGKAWSKGDVKMESVDGKQVTLDGVAGKMGTLVVFTCNHCPYAQAWEGRITALGNEYMKKGFGVIAINSNDFSDNPVDDLEHMKERAKNAKMEFPYAVDADSSVARAFGASKTPEVFLFDKDKKLAYTGSVDDNSEKADAVKNHYLKDALAALADGKAVPKAETKAIGCGIHLRKPAK